MISANYPSDITRKVRVYFIEALGHFSAALNPEADELDDEERLALIEAAIAACARGEGWYRADPEIPHPELPPPSSILAEQA